MTSWLDLKNIEKTNSDVEYHPLKPFIFVDTRVVFLGSFPPQRKRWCMDFYYPNFINDHWRIEGLIFYNNKNFFVDEKMKRFHLDEIVKHCKKKGIGFYDTATVIRRLAENASDKFLEVVETTDFKSLMTLTNKLQAIVTTGSKATETICHSLNINHYPNIGEYINMPDTNDIKLYRLPSSSRAYPLSLEKKAEAYQSMFRLFGLI